VNEGQAFFLFAIVFVVGFLVVMTPVIMLVNRSIGATYDRRAAAIAPYLQAEGMRFSEDGVRMRASWVAPLAVALRWKTVDVRVTSRAIYLVQSTRMFGMRIGQPILAFPLRGAQLDPFVASNVMTGWLGTIRTDDAAHLTGGLSVQRFTMRLAVRDLAGFAAATA
jgi:hypothetical protein